MEIVMTEIDLNAFRLTSEGQRMIEIAQRGKPASRPRSQPRLEGTFLKGPIPMAWLKRAWQSGKAGLVMGILLWYLEGLQRSRRNFRGDRKVLQVNVSKLAIEHRLLRQFLSRGVAGLERSGLIVVVDRKPGQKLKVQLLYETST
jgi:hypothetical protein